jgi:hypothetical protein
VTLSTLLVTGLRIVAAIVAYLVCFVVAYGLLLSDAPVSASEPPASAARLLTVALMTVLPIAWIILRARPRGWKLVAPMLLVFFGVQTFLPQLESIIFQVWPAFARHVPIAFVPRLMAAGLLHAILWVPLAVPLLGRWKADSTAETIPASVFEKQGSMLLVAAALYVVIYFTFGYYVAWRNPAVPRYYGGTDAGSFLGQLWTLVRDMPWLPLVQLLRGMMWTWLGMIVFRTMRGSTIEKALAMGIAFAIVMNAGLLLPNPYMPADVRMAHFAETTSSNFLFGVLLAWLIARHDRASDTGRLSCARQPAGPDRSTRPTLYN